MLPQISALTQAPSLQTLPAGQEVESQTQTATPNSTMQSGVDGSEQSLSQH
jgi:hypothetical protein